ncbi:MAG: hypothetical protein K8R59_16485 [Thermoanaerobaculales bacterium]|nr:hypothetical protein [Thermoanaerobaculales bacterium]
MDAQFDGSEEEAPRLSDGETYAFENLREGRIEEAVGGIRAAGDEYTQAIPHLEAILNSAGYDHLGRQDYPGAIALFRLNVDLFPGSANVYDSLGEAFMLDGQRELAIRNYRRSLDLNPANANAEEKLQELRASRV